MRARLHGLVTLLEQLDELREADVHLSGFREQSVGSLGEDAQLLLAGQGRAALGDIGARRAPLDDDAGRLQLAVGPGYGVRVDDELLGEDADGRQLLAW